MILYFQGGPELFLGSLNQDNVEYLLEGLGRAEDV